MCRGFGAFAYLCSAVVGSSELLHQNSLKVAAVAEAEINEHGTEMETWAHSVGMQRSESPKVLQLPMVCAVKALKVLVL